MYNITQYSLQYSIKYANVTKLVEILPQQPLQEQLRTMKYLYQAGLRKYRDIRVKG